MATVSHYAMQPHPALYGNGNGNPQLTSNQYYVASNQQLSPMYDKTKKTWSQRLKITKSEKISSPLSELPDYSQSALSRSMKYAEPWLYGTVRGIPARPLHGQAIFTPIPSEVAVVVCSCPEYLNGTKKEIKKASVCKKCKGSRLPLAPIGGTVRIRPTSAPIVHTPRASVGTVRLSSSSSMKSRPSILDPRNDPYDLMRRSRLISPEPKQIIPDKSLKLRAKSVSPTRGRSRNRNIRPDELILSNGSIGHSNGNGSIKYPHSMRMKSERWLESIENDPGGRRSILQCYVNPYDLISNKSQTNSEFAPDPDLFLPSPKAESMPKKVSSTSRSNVKAIAGQRISLGQSLSKATSNSRFNRESSSVSFIPRKADFSSNPDYKQEEWTTKSESSEEHTELPKPKRPPRKKHETSSADEEPSDLTEKTVTKLSQLSPGQLQPSSSPRPLPSLQIRIHDHTSGTSPSSRQGIKSILKRPSSVTPSSSDTDAKNNDSIRPEKICNKSANLDNADGKSHLATKHTFNFNENDSPCDERLVGSGSQFYLPLPQTRKKVQFMVENRIILHEVHDSQTNDTASDAILLNGSKEESDSRKLKELRTQTYVTKDAHSSTNADDERTQSNIVTKEHLKDFNSLQRVQQKNGFRSRLEIGSNNDSYKQSHIENRSNKSTTSTVATKSPSLNSKENCLIVVNAAQKNSTVSQCPDTDTKETGFGRRMVRENGSAQDSDQLCKETFKSASTSKDLTSPTRRMKSLRRTHSARSNNTTTVLLNFNDTMALRVRNIRPDSRDVFTEGAGYHSSATSSLPARLPTAEPLGNGLQTSLSPTRHNEKDSSFLSPVSLVPQATATRVLGESVSPRATSISEIEVGKNSSKNDTQPDRETWEILGKDATKVFLADSGAEILLPRPPRQTYKKLPWQQEIEANATVKSEHQEYPHESDGVGISSEYLYGESSENTGNGKMVVQKRGNNEKDIVDRRISPVSTEAALKQALANKMTDKEKLLQARNEILHGSRLFGSTFDNGVQKTIVRVAPFNNEESAVHRLKIRHEENSASFSPSQEKTSILINGDNCYSTVNVSSDAPLYQSSVVVNNGVSTISTDAPKMSLNTVTINVSNPSTPEEEFTRNHNKINALLSLNNNILSPDIQASNVYPSSSSSCTASDGDSSSYSGSLKRGSTLITLDFGKDNHYSSRLTKEPDAVAHEQELVKILRDPVEAVKRNLIPHVCGKSEHSTAKSTSDKPASATLNPNDLLQPGKQLHSNSFISKLLEDPTLHQLAEGLESDVVVKLIENSLKRLRDSRQSLDTSGTKDNETMNKLIDLALQRVKEERMKLEAQKQIDDAKEACEVYAEDRHENGSISSNNSYGSANYDLFDFDNNESDCYQSCSSEMTTEEDAQSTRSKFYQMLVDATLSEIEISTSNEDDHHYESIRLNCDPIYEEIGDVPPPLPLSPPPVDSELDKKITKSMFEGASKYDILSYLVDAKERGIVREESYEYNFGNTGGIIVEEEIDTLGDLNKNKANDASSRVSHLSMTSDSSEDNSLTSSISDKLIQRRPASEVERNDSGVGSETSKSSRSKYQNPAASSIVSKNSPIHLCEDCDGPVETQITDSGVMYAPLVCRKCSKKRAERKEIIIEIVETEEKYGRDLLIILEEFCKPMLVAGLLTQEQLSAIFLNTEELLENSQALAEKMRDALDIALEQGDDDLLTVNMGRILLEATPMLHAFEAYCVRQGAASLLLANMEKDKELLRIFLRVSQMENAVLRRMNLNSFLMVPVQRVTKYPLLLARLFKVTPPHLESRPFLKQAREKIELHLNHMNQEAKDVPTKLWRRISSSSPNRRSSCEIDMINIKLRKMAVDVLEWNHDEVRFAMEGKLLFTQPTDSNWKKARTIKLTHINALLVTNGKPSGNYKPEKALTDQLSFPKHTGVREASLLMVKEKCGRYSLIREPLYLDRCIVCTEADWDDYFEVHEISSKDTFIFKAEDGTRTKQWYTQLQYHSQGMGGWRKRRNALANIMINGMLSRT